MASSQRGGTFLNGMRADVSSSSSASEGTGDAPRRDCATGSCDASFAVDTVLHRCGKAWLEPLAGRSAAHYQPENGT